MNAIDLLQQQHERARELCARFEVTLDAGDRQMLFNELADVLALHLEVEERHLYPATAAPDEHVPIKTLLGDLLTYGVAEDGFEPRYRILVSALDALIDHENQELLPRLARTLTPARLAALGRMMQATEAELLGSIPVELFPADASTTADLVGLASAEAGASPGRAVVN